MKITIGRRRLTAAACAATLIAAAGVAYASIPDGNGIINGCYTNKGGILRVIDPAAGQKMHRTGDGAHLEPERPEGGHRAAGDPWAEG